MTLSATERQVLAALTADGRATLRDVADAADLPTATVAETVQALEDRGVVTGYRPDVDYAELGYETVAVFRVGLNQSMLPTVRRRLVDERLLTTVYEVAGAFDVVAVGRYEGDEDVEAQRRALWAIPGVTDVSADGPTVRVACAAPGAKMAALRRLDDRATVEDVTIEESSLEDLFEAYTAERSGDGTATDAGADGRPAAGSSPEAATAGGDRA